MDCVLKSFKGNESAGIDKLKTKGLKYRSGKKLIEVILMLFTLIWSYASVPTTKLHGTTTCLHK